MFLLAGVLAALLWDMGTRLDNALHRFFAVAVALTGVLRLIHVLVTVEWSGVLAPIFELQRTLRPGTWSPPAHLLPIGVLLAIWLARRGTRSAWPVVAMLTALAIALVAVFLALPRFTPPGAFGITRPTLLLPPMLWIAVVSVAWRQRAADRVLPILAVSAPSYVLGHVAILYARGPDDEFAMAAHLGVASGFLAILLQLMRMASLDMRARLRAERALAVLNEELEHRVLERTADLQSANARVQAHIERLYLLQQITRAIDERQDLQSIMQVVVRSLEDQLAVDLACICTYDPGANILVVTSVGVRSHALAMELALTDQARVDIDRNGLSHCVGGTLVYEPDVSETAYPFPTRLARGGLRSMVAAPLRAESRVFGVLIVARRQAHSFSSGECEFLRQLSDHTALAAHQARLYSTLQEAYDDLRQTQHVVMQQERLRALGQMASGIAHDINNAVLPVSLYTEALLEQEVLSERARRDLEVVQRAVDDVAQTVARLGEFTRPREAQLFAPVNLNEVVEQVVDLTRARWSDIPQRRGDVIDLKLELSDTTPLVLGVASEVREALTNLVFNAVDAMPDGGSLTIRTLAAHMDMSGRDGASRPSVEVQDTGSGMSEETRRRCLEPFFTTKGERGSGLGLAMVYGVMQRHGGDLEIESALGSGTTMRLTFPASQPAAARSGDAPRRFPLRHLRLLIVDDDPLILRSLRSILEADGHSVASADGGQAGIDAFRSAVGTEGMFAAVITDLGMPHVDGRQVAAAVKATSPNTPVILLTGWGQRLLAEDDVPGHVDRVVPKPPKLSHLRDALAYCVSADGA